MSYYTYFEISAISLPWWEMPISVVLIIVGILLWRMKGRAKIASVPFWLVGLIWLVFMPLIFNDSAQQIRGYRSGRYKVVEGPVANFRPMTPSGHDTESFTVDGVLFSYSNFVLSPCFNQTVIVGGPIKKGLKVRISYIDDCIVKLELPR